MATVTTVNSPQELIDYLNTLTALGTYLQDWFVVDAGGGYTVIEETPFVVTTLKSETDLKAFLETGLTGTVKNIVPKSSGGRLTFIKILTASAGAQAWTLQIADDAEALETILTAATTVIATVEHQLKTLIIEA